MKKRILMVGLSSTIGGIEKFIFNVKENIDKDKFELYYLVFEEDDFFLKYNIDTSNVFKCTNRKKNYFKCIRDIKEIFINNKFDVIHFNLMNYSFWEVIYLARKYALKSKIILHSHTSNIKTEKIKTQLISMLGKRIINPNSKEYKLIACSTTAGEALFNNEIFSIVNNGVELMEYKFSKETRTKIRKELDISENTIVIGNVGRFISSKNQVFLIKIFEKIKNSDYKLLLIGDGVEKNKIQGEVFEKKLQDRIIFLGEEVKVCDYLNAMDVFLFPSKYEGLGISIIEAQQNGLPCIINEGLPKEVNVTNLIERLPLNNLDRWVSNVLNIKLKRNRETDIINMYDINNTVKEIECIYEGDK